MSTAFSRIISLIVNNLNIDYDRNSTDALRGDWLQKTLYNDTLKGGLDPCDRYLKKIFCVHSQGDHYETS